MRHRRARMANSSSDIFWVVVASSESPVDAVRRSSRTDHDGVGGTNTVLSAAEVVD